MKTWFVEPLERMLCSHNTRTPWTNRYVPREAIDFLDRIILRAHKTAVVGWRSNR